MLVLEPGCGMGFFTIELARLVGPGGKVVAVDVQPKMLTGLRRRARRAGIDARVEVRLAADDVLSVEDLVSTVDFALAFAIVHELPDERRFFAELHRVLTNGSKLLLAEPKGHVTEVDFAATLQAAERSGFRATDGPAIRWSRTAVLERR
jgi:ubiquinone/menaquinone biosynthesis C-methylase UbiE